MALGHFFIGFWGLAYLVKQLPQLLKLEFHEIPDSQQGRLKVSHCQVSQYGCAVHVSLISCVLAQDDIFKYQVVLGGYAQFFGHYGIGFRVRLNW